MSKIVERPRSDLSGLTKATKEAFEEFVRVLPESCERVEWRRPGTLYYSRLEIIGADGTVLAAHDENGDYWIRQA